MTDRPATNCYNLDDRMQLFEHVGGLADTTVRNTEWLYMLEEDTRQSLAIEGHFATEEELEAVLHGGKTDLAITNYFRAAQTVYDQALQYARDKVAPPLSVLIALALETHASLLDLAEVAALLGIKKGTLRQRISRGRHIAIKRGKKLYSHPSLAL